VAQSANSIKNGVAIGFREVKDKRIPEMNLPIRRFSRSGRCRYRELICPYLRAGRAAFVTEVV